jgi:hypothetical protein
MALADRLNGELTELHRGRLAQLGPSASGLYAHYQVLVDRGALVARREAAVLYLIDANLPPYDAYAVLRAGLGELALLLAASGRKVIAFEPDAQRRSALCAGLTHLEERGLVPPGAVTVLPTLVPTGGLHGRVLGLGLDVAHVRDEAAAAELIGSMAAFAELLVDLRLFLRFRERPAEKALAVSGLEALGLERWRDFPLAGGLTWFRRPDATDELESVGVERSRHDGRGSRPLDG